MTAQVKAAVSYFGWWYAESDIRHFKDWAQHNLPHLLYWMFSPLRDGGVYLVLEMPRDGRARVGIRHPKINYAATSHSGLLQGWVTAGFMQPGLRLGS
jgi:hypothetical protein